MIKLHPDYGLHLDLWAAHLTKQTFLLYSLLLTISSTSRVLVNGAAECDWRSRSYFHVVRAILQNQLENNNTIIWELAGIFSNKQKPLKQVIVHYEILLPINPDCIDTFPDCEIDNGNNFDDCPAGYNCIRVDYVWGRYPVTAQDEVFRDLDVCPLVIGDYEQRDVNIFFRLDNPPSCDSSFLNVTNIEEEIFPCGWDCKQFRRKLPLSGEPSQPIFVSVEQETPVDRALSGITAKLLQYATIKDTIDLLDYGSTDAIGYSAKLNAATYFIPGVEYGLFLSSYFLLNMVIFMLMFGYRELIYDTIANYLKIQIQFCLFWSFVLTFFLFFINITIIFAIEGGFCITLLQLYALFISLSPGLFYPIIATFFVEKKAQFFKAFDNLICNRFGFLDRLMQVLVLCFIYTLPHVLLLVIYLVSVSFFYNPHSTSILVLYFSSSSMILWIVNAVVIHLVSPYLFVCGCSSSTSLDIEDDVSKDTVVSKGDNVIAAIQRIVFAICLGLSLNLMNFSVMPFVGDYFYDRRVQGSTVFAIVPIGVTLIGWYVSGDMVKIISKLSFNKKKLKQQGSEIPNIKPEVAIKMTADDVGSRQPNKDEKQQPARTYPHIGHFRNAFHNIVKQSSAIIEEPDLDNNESQRRVSTKSDLENSTAV